MVCAMKRAGVLSILVVVLLAVAVVAEAQQAKKVWRIGLSHVGLDHVPPPLETLRQELKRLGYEEGKNIQLDWRTYRMRKQRPGDRALSDRDSAGGQKS
jgi:hypothetical protein